MDFCEKIDLHNPTIFPCIQQVNFVQPFTAFQVLPMFQTVIGEQVERTGIGDPSGPIHVWMAILV